MARLFFALWPGEGARERLAAAAFEVAARCEGRAVPAGKIHLTLAFLGDVDPGNLPQLAQAAAAIRADAFTASFDRLGAFSRAGVAWAGCARVPARLTALASAVAKASAGLGIALEARPFAAHVTLARRIRRRLDAPLEPAVEWRAESFALVESDLATGRYVTRGSWELGTR